MGSCCSCGSDYGASRPGTNLLYCGDCWSSSNAIEFIVDTFKYLLSKMKN